MSMGPWSKAPRMKRVKAWQERRAADKAREHASKDAITAPQIQPEAKSKAKKARRTKQDAILAPAPAVEDIAQNPPQTPTAPSATLQETASAESQPKQVGLYSEPVDPSKHIGLYAPLEQGETEETTHQPSNKGRNRFTNDIVGLPYALRFHMADAMLKAGKTWVEIRAYTGLSTATINKVKQVFYEINQNVSETLRRCEEQKVTHLRHRMIDSVQDSDVQNASLKDRIICYGILAEKGELMAGRATTRTEFVQQGDSELDAEAARLQAEIEAYKADAMVTSAEVGTPHVES